MSLFGNVKRHILRIDRPQKDLRREIWKDPLRDIQRFIANTKTVFDVDANEGQSAIRFKDSFPLATIHCFEPHKPTFQKLIRTLNKLPNVYGHNLALSDSVGYGTLHISSASVLNSVLAPSSERQKQFSGTQVPIVLTTIDEFCSEKNIDSIDLLKIDVQGSELVVLSGGESLLRNGRIKSIYLEINFVDFYVGQAYWWEIAEHLAERGYTLFDFYNSVYGQDGHIRWCDALFLEHNLRRLYA